MHSGLNEHIYENSSTHDAGEKVNNEVGYSIPLNVVRRKRYGKGAKLYHQLKGDTTNPQYAQSCRSSNCTNKCECERCRRRMYAPLRCEQDHITYGFGKTEMKDRETVQYKSISHTIYRRNLGMEYGDITEMDGNDDAEAECAHVTQSDDALDDNHEGKSA